MNAKERVSPSQRRRRACEQKLFYLRCRRGEASVAVSCADITTAKRREP